MATSGIDVDPKITEALDEIKKRQRRFGLFQISADQKMIESCEDTDGVTCINLVDLKDDPEKAEELSKEVMMIIGKELGKHPTIPRYVYVNAVLNKDSRNVDKMVLIHFNPDGAKVKDKMLYSSSKDALKKVIPTSFVDLPIDDITDFDNFKSLRADILSKSGSS